MNRRQPHPVTAPDVDALLLSKRGKSRGSYNCSRCGLPKKGHVCQFQINNNDDVAVADESDSSATAHTPPISTSFHYTSSNLRRALSFDEVVAESEVEVEEVEAVDEDEDEEVEFGPYSVPVRCMWEVMRRLPPPSLLTAAKVCRGWRDVSTKVWKAAEEVRIRVLRNSQVGFVGSLTKKCPNLIRLTLRMEIDFDATMLACIAFSCPNLESLQIFTSDGAVNRLTGDELGRFVADKRCLASLKMEGCSHLRGFCLCSSSLSMLWLSDLHSLSKMVFKCPNLDEISLDFSRQHNDTTNLTTLVEGLGRTCPRLMKVHIASLRLSHSSVLSLTAANLRCLRMLSLVLGSGITDASVAAITSSYSNLELLDLSGSSISDSGIGMICNVYPETLSRLLLALCPNITSSGVQFATAQLPHLELMDCGMTICEHNESGLARMPNSKLHLTYQKLIIKHAQLKKLSLWGCSGLDALYLNCPDLCDLNLNSCQNLHPDKVQLQCPNLERVHATACRDILVKTIRNQVSSHFTTLEHQFSRKRLADGSKRIQAPTFLYQQTFDDEKKGWRIRKRRCEVLVD